MKVVERDLENVILIAFVISFLVLDAANAKNVVAAMEKKIIYLKLITEIKKYLLFISPQDYVHGFAI